MRTNIDLDDDLISEAQRLGGLRTKREAVDVALREFVARRRQLDVLALDGHSLLSADYDVRAARRQMGKR